MPSSTQATSNHMSNEVTRLQGDKAQAHVWARRQYHWHSVTLLPCYFVASLLVACAHVPNQWVEDGPAAVEDWHTPTESAILAARQPAPPRHRDWGSMQVAAENGAVLHWPTYFEDPFVDRGHGRQGLNRYHVGWEDYVAMPYGYARHTVNWLFFPVSAVVTPFWITMESDGVVSRQALGYDHDAIPAGREPPPQRTE